MKGTLFRVLWVDLLSLFFPCFTFRHLGWVFPSIGFRSNRCRGWCLYVLFRGAEIWHVNTSWFLHKFLYRWVAECCKRKQKSNKYSTCSHSRVTYTHISIAKARAAIEAFLSESSSVEKPPQAWQVLWRNHIVFQCGDTTQRIEFQVLKECSKFAKPNQCVFIICQCV